jgi:hypothetical protein
MSCLNKANTFLKCFLSQWAKPMLLILPRLNARRLFCEFSRAIGMDSQLSFSPSGTAKNDLLNSQNNGMKSIVKSGFFCLLFLAAAKK